MGGLDAGGERGIRYASSDYWIAYYISFLTDERIIEPAAREERLEKKATTWLEHVLSNPRE